MAGMAKQGVARQGTAWQAGRKNMTTKEIAMAVGKDESTVRRWLRDLAGKIPAIAGKMHASTSTYPADYTLEETIEIIREGMGDSAAGIFQANSQQTKPGSLRLPNGKQLQHMIQIYGPEEAGKRIDFLMGYSEAMPEFVPVVERLGRISKQAYAVEMKYREQQNRSLLEARHPDLFGGRI
jgi:transcriptional regulator with XRE-family HTH domain